VIVCDLNLVCVSGSPLEADAPLIVNSNAVLTRSIPPQLLQPISGRYAQLRDSLGGVQDQKLALGSAPDRGGKAASFLTPKDAFSITIGEALDHALQ